MTRSSILLSAMLAAWSVAYGQSDKTKETNDYLIMRTPAPTPGPDVSITIHQEVNLNATPQRVYEVLLNSKQFTEFSGRPAEIDAKVGGVFSLFKGHIIGRNVELIPNRRIVQAWRVVTWPEGAWSIARFELNPQGSGTRIVFDHIGFPEGLHDHLAEGWEQNYWSLLTKYFH